MKTRLIVVALSGLLALAGCGAGSESADGPSASNPVKITVANLAVTNSAGLVLGVKKGFFTDAGLDVTIRDTPAASTVPAVVSGQAQFAFTGVPPLINARSNKLMIKAVAPAAGYPKDLAASQIRLMVPASSPITSPKDLEGKTVAIDTLFQLPQLSLIQALKTEGVDTSKITFKEIPYPSMPDALAKGDVDAADMADPFLGKALAAGNRAVISNGVGFDSGATQVIWVASDSYIAKNPKIVKAFAAAVVKSNTYAQSHPDEVRSVVATLLKVPETAAAKILLPEYTTSIDPAVFDVYNTLLTDLEVIKEPVAAKDAIAQ